MTQDWVETLRSEPPILVTGAAGFIGHNLSARLLDAGVAVVGVDNLCPYYDVALKRARIEDLRRRPGFRFFEVDLVDRAAMRAAFDACGPRRIAHLAAQAGVRHSLKNPKSYVESNLTGFLTILEESRRLQVDHLLYASSSSVYGGNRKLPFATSDAVDHPVNLYAATKRANELMAHAYSHLYGVPATGLRFFTVYGPWGRPDMACWRFAEAILEGRPIDVYNEGRMARDFTYVDDVSEAVARLAPRPPAPNPDYDATQRDPAGSWAPHRILNIGATAPEGLMDMIESLEDALGRKAEKRLLPMQPGDMLETWADTADLDRIIGPARRTPLREGLVKFAQWLIEWRSLTPPVAVDP